MIVVGVLVDVSTFGVTSGLDVVVGGLVANEIASIHGLVVGVGNEISGVVGGPVIGVVGHIDGGGVGLVFGVVEVGKSGGRGREGGG